MNTQQWFTLFESAFREMDKNLEQVLLLSSCREHWIQAQISLHAWSVHGVDIWTDLPIGNRRKADLYSLDEAEKPIMVAEVKCLGDLYQAKCLDGAWSVRADIERLRSFPCPARLFVLVIAKDGPETAIGRRLREDDWDITEPSVDVELGHARIRMWSL